MSLIENYKQGSWKDRVDYILSLSDKTEIEMHLKNSALTSYDDLQMLIFILKSTKNQKHLIEIFKNDSLPVRQRVKAAKAWLQIEKDEKQIHQFVTETITASNIPRLIKHQILKYLHHIHCLKTSSSFFYNLACQLTESLHHDEFNIDAHTLPFCSSNQIMDLLSRWSLIRYSQICFSSSFCSKLIRYQPLIVIHLIKGDLNDKYTDYDKLWNYCWKNRQLLELLAKKEPKAMCRLAIEYVNRLEKHRKILPAFIESEQKRMFDKAPDEMIELISLVASYQPGTIKYELSWDPSGMELYTFQFPRSFSIDHYIRLFFVLYETCQWSINNTSSVVKYMFSNDGKVQKLSFLHQQRTWFFNFIIEKRIGREEFLNKLFKNGTETHLQLLKDFPELSIPFARHLLAQLNQSEVISAYQRGSFLRYELMTSDIFDQFVSLFQQCGSDINERKQMYIFLFQCAVSTDRQSVKRVLQWIEKRFTNEQLVVIENFLRNLSSYDDRFHLEYLPDNFETIETIMDLAFNHIQRTSTTLEIILAYGLLLLVRAENSPKTIQEFACKIIKQYYSTNITFLEDYVLLPKARHLLANILVSDIFPKLISKSLVTEINNLLMKYFHNACHLPQIDLFLHSFFFEHLRCSIKLQSVFDINEHSFLISLLLKPSSTRLERVHRLLNEIDQIFFLHTDVQRALLCSRSDRQFIDQLLKNEKCLNADRLSKEQTNFSSNKKIPGFDIAILNHCYYQLTEQQQEYITIIILNDHLPDAEISNLEKLKALRVLRRLTHTYQNTLQWIEQKQYSFLPVSSDASSLTNKPTRGANIQTINHYILSLPATFDLVTQDLFKQFDRLTTQLNAPNAIYVKDALLCISQKVTDQYFLERYIEFIRSEYFSKLGITAKKAMLRLLIQYRFNSTLIVSILKPLWDSRPHPDIRTCLIMILLQFIHESNMNNDESIVWSILEEAAHDDYHPVILALFGANEKGICRSSRRLKESSTFVKRIQMKILDHPTSLTGRIWAWSSLDSEYCEINLIIDKARQLCIQFDKDANVLWKEAFKNIISFYKLQKISAKDMVDFIQSIMNYREELDLNQNSLNDQNDLPVYRRLNTLLELLIASIGEIDLQQRLCFRSFARSILQFEITMAATVGSLLIKLAENKDDLDEILTIFQQYLPTTYFEHVIFKLASTLSANDGSCPFIQQLNIEEKFQLALWFINERNQALFVFDLLKNEIFNKSSVDNQQCQLLLRQMRQSKNLLLRQQALEYKVPWRNDGTINNDD